MLTGNRIVLKQMEESDAAAYTDLLIRNRHVWQAFEPSRSKEYYTIENQRKAIREDKELFKKGRAYNFGIFLNDNGGLIGDISLYDVKMGFFQSASTGYSIDTDLTGKGFASEALDLMITFAFQTLKLRRMEAGVSPENPRSMRVLEKNGFRREGLMRENLLINGEWKDHYLYALLAKDLDG
ncbi:GNAT family N-acetyltransferase [Peribacillus kribbensis]|uniref:GNAT family N-acetyltransferase n=1 Tax=Peribacillus kribbensis TaxID=356658 RepID=UPI00042150B8|nr:GNAT family protein [Peribacillus kribbensis]